MSVQKGPCHCFGGLGLRLLLPLLLLTFYFNRRIAAKSFALQSVAPGDPEWRPFQGPVSMKLYCQVGPSLSGLAKASVTLPSSLSLGCCSDLGTADQER